MVFFFFFFFSSRRRHTRSLRDWSSDVCSSDLADLRTESGRSRVSELEAPLRSRSGATTVMLARSASVSARIAMPGAKYPSSLLSRMRIYRLVWNSGRFYSKSAPRRSENTAHVLDRGQGALQ